MAGQAAFHLAHFTRFHAQAFGHAVDFLVVQPRQAFFWLRRLKNSLRWALVVATFTMRQLRRMNSWISALIQCTANDTKHTHLRVEALYRLHQANVALLDQVSLGQAVAAIATGDMYDKTQVGEHHLPSRPKSCS